MKKSSKKKVCFAASSGGHYEQLLMLKPLIEKYDSFILTERTDYSCDVQGEKVYFIPRMIINLFKTIQIYIKERPDVVICTGVLAMIPMCLIAKLFKKKLIYIESFAKVTSGTETGKLMYKFADKFYVQWEQMLDVYPNATFKGSIY